MSSFSNSSNYKNVENLACLTLNFFVVNEKLATHTNFSISS